jgi:hypothetical protein
MRDFLSCMYAYIGAVSLTLLALMLVLTAIAVATLNLMLTIPAMIVGVIALFTVKGG